MSDFVVVAAAIVQGVSALVIASLTWRLVRATNDYVRETRALAEEAKRTNDLTQRSTERALRRNAGILKISVSGRSQPDGQSPWKLSYLVENVGEGAAHEAALHFAEFNGAGVNRPLRPGEKAHAVLEIPSTEVTGTPEHPHVLSATFRDPDGSWWEQTARRVNILGPPHLLSDGDA